MKRVIIRLTDDSVGVEDLPDGVVVEIHDYRERSVYDLYLPHSTDERGVEYVVYQLD